MCPLPPQCWATRILKHWDHWNTQINFGEGETHTSVSRFLTRIVAYHFNKFIRNEKKIATCALRLHLNIFAYVKWMLHSLKLTARNSSNGNTLHYAERLASSTVNSRLGILMFNASNVCIFLQFFCAIIRVTWELPFGKKKKVITPNMYCRHLVSINCSCFLFVYLLAVAVFCVADNTIPPFAFTSIEIWSSHWEPISRWNLCSFQ